MRLFWRKKQPRSVVMFRMPQLMEAVKQLADEDKPGPFATQEEWVAWRERWAEGLAEIMHAARPEGS